MTKKKSETDVAEKPKTEAIAGEAPAAQLPATMKLRLPYPIALGKERDITPRGWGVLIDAVWPSAKTVEGVCMAINYCHERHLDPFKKVVHIVPMNVKTKGNDGRDHWREIETVWPGIAETRITATRTGVYAGKDAAEFGPIQKRKFQKLDDRETPPKLVSEVELEFPEWCRITVYKVVKGIRCAFVGPMVYWDEAYAKESRYSDIPNEMWRDRRNGQLEKCAEAASLRAAFPEELGDEKTAEEMYGKTIDQAPENSVEVKEGQMVPPRPVRSEFERKFQEQERQAEADKKPKDAKAKPAETTGGDPRGDAPPIEGEVVAEGEKKTDPVVEEKPKPETVKTVEPDPETPAFKEVSEKLTEYLATATTADSMDEFKERGVTVIDTYPGLTDEEKAKLRGILNSAVLVERKRRSQKSKT
jgi:phage recombination protein Bet